MRVVSK